MHRLIRTVTANLFSISQTVLIVLIVVLVVVFVVVIFPENPEWIFNLLGVAEKGEPKYEALKFLGIGMGGVLVALQALMSYKRAKAMEQTAEAQADAAKAQADAVLKTEQGQRQERLKNAIEHLGHEKDSVRMGGAYELFHLAEDTEELRQRQTVLDILCAHIRQTTGENKYREAQKAKPSEEVQSLLTLLFVQEYKVFKGCYINLQGSWLNSANLREARLETAILTGVHLQGAKLDRAHLQRANLVEAHLEEAFLSEAWLHETDLFCVRMQGAYLKKARLQGACLMGTRLQGAYLGNAHLQGAYLRDVSLEGAYLVNAQLQGAYLSFVYLLGASLSEAKLQGAGEQSWTSSTPFAGRIRKSIDKKYDLSKLVFGGIEQKAVDGLVEGLSDDKTTLIRECLRPHIGKPLSYQLPEDSGAITGTYTKEEAEKWIAEYEKAMSEVPEDDS